MYIDKGFVALISIWIVFEMHGEEQGERTRKGERTKERK